MRVLIFLVVLATFSCNPGKQLTKAEARLAQAGRLPAICSERFPVRDKCDLAGIWKPNFTLATYVIGSKVDEEMLLNIDNGNQFERLQDGKILCIDFVTDRLRLLRGKVRRVEGQKEPAKVDLRRRAVRAGLRQHRGHRAASLQQRP